MRVPKIIRRITDPVLERVPVPVVGGLNRGRWWNLASAGSGYVNGRRAADQLRLLRALMRPGGVVWDVGAHHGYVTLLAAAEVGPEGQVHAFEPGERNARILERHLRWNRVANAVVHPLALGSFNGEASFGGGNTSKMHALGGGEEKVSVRTAESLVRSGEATAPTFVKIDVEGAEGDVLEGALEVLPPQASLVIAVHSAAADQRCTQLLEARGFELVPSRGLEEARRRGWHYDPDLFCMGPAFEAADRIRRLLRDTGF